ncbi:MAG: hypothetical protein U9Q83_07885 [Bacteroidota bacterium]|nr:hypothetical protein [Bacteroidota bacterium]
MKRIIILLAVIFFTATNLFSQKITKVYKHSLCRTEYYDDEYTMLYYSVQNDKGELVYYNAKGEIINLKDYEHELKQKKQKKRKSVLFKNWRKDSDKSVLSGGSGEYEAGGMVYSYENGRLVRVRFVDHRDRDDSSPGP